MLSEQFYRPLGRSGLQVSPICPGSDNLRQACDELVPLGSAVADFLNSAPWMKGKLL